MANASNADTIAAIPVVEKNPNAERGDVNRANATVMFRGLRNRYLGEFTLSWIVLLKMLFAMGPKKTWTAKNTARNAAKLQYEKAVASLLERIDDEEKQSWLNAMGWAPGYRYNWLESALTTLLGDPNRTMQFASEAGAESKFGLTYGWQLKLLEFGMSLAAVTTSPSFAFAEILPMMGLELNRSKIERQVSATAFSCIMRTLRVKATHSELPFRKPELDHSELGWYFGFIASLTNFFIGRSAKVFRMVVEMDIFNYWKLASSYIGTGYGFQTEGEMEEVGAKLFLDHFDGATRLSHRWIGERVRLHRETGVKDGGIYFTQVEPSANMDAYDPTNYRYAWRMRQDVTVTAPDGHTWKIFWAGQYYCPEAGCSLTRYSYKPDGVVRCALYWVQGYLFLKPAIAAVLLVCGVLLATGLWASNFIVSGTVAAVVIPFLLILITVLSGTSLFVKYPFTWGVQRMVKNLIAENHREIELIEARELKAEIDARLAETFLCREHATRALAGLLDGLHYSEATIIGVDLEGYSKLSKWLKKNYPATEANRLLQLLVRVWKQAHYDYCAHPAMAKGKFLDSLVHGEPVSSTVATGGDGYYTAMLNAKVDELLLSSIQYAFSLHDAAALIFDQPYDIVSKAVQDKLKKEFRPSMAMRAVIVDADGGLYEDFFGRTRSDGLSNNVRSEMTSAGIIAASRLEDKVKEIRMAAAEVGHDANRLLVMPRDLWEMLQKQATAEEQSLYTSEYLGLHDVRSISPFHLVRVLDAACTVVPWEEVPMVAAAIASGEAE